MRDLILGKHLAFLHLFDGYDLPIAFIPTNPYLTEGTSTYNLQRFEIFSTESLPSTFG
jgi:hypothetical protein